MRRKDREVTDIVKIREIIAACTCCRLGLCDGGKAYIVPLSFGFMEEKGCYTFYFHSALEGRKIDILRKTGRAAFEMDTGYELTEAPKACGWSARYSCVMGEGPVTLVDTAAEKREGLRVIMAHLTGRDQWDFDEAVLEKTCVFRLEAEELTCKVHS
ncbi:MAG: pyridoxamine 5'-phosphate oxidase family protein [Dysosmobacter sp.]|nr:pyridoxamine 5'-phosphate oxidase family protein [Dysosmobacter sp.]